MLIEAWWQFNLTQEFPLQDRRLWVKGENYRPSVTLTTKWPVAVARDALYMDFIWWYETRVSGGMVSKPKCPDRNTFFTVLSPFLYPRGKAYGAKNYNIIKKVPYQGRWQEVKARRYFARLCDLREHINVYEANMGCTLFQASRRSEERSAYT